MSAVMQSTSPVAVLENVSLRYRKVCALDHIDLEIPSGCMVGVIGPDGVGKSSLLSLLAGTRQVQEGKVTVLGADMSSARNRNRVCPDIAYMPQGLGRNLYPTLSIEENLQFFGRLFGHDAAERRRRIDLLTRATGLQPFLDRPVGKLSGGMKQKLGLCCALIHDPKLLILDEPTTGVDPVSRRELWILLNRLHHDGLTLIASTPYMDEAEYATRIAFLDAGRVIASGTPDELIAAYPRALVEVQTPARVEVRRRLASLPAVEDVSVFGTRLHVRGRNADAAGLRDAVAAHLSGVVDGAAVRPIPAGLEDVFVWQGAAGGHDG